MRLRANGVSESIVFPSRTRSALNKCCILTNDFLCNFFRVKSSLVSGSDCGVALPYTPARITFLHLLYVLFESTSAGRIFFSLKLEKGNSRITMSPCFIVSVMRSQKDYRYQSATNRRECGPRFPFVPHAPMVRVCR